MSVCVKRDGRGEDRRERADIADDLQRFGPGDGRVEREEPRDEIDARRHHRRGVDQRAHRRRASHRVGQPDVQRELRGLADRAAEDEDHRRRGEHDRQPRRAGLRAEVEVGEVEGAGRDPEEQDADQEAEVAQARRDEGFELRGRRPGNLGASGRLLLAEEEADQQVGREADQLPADEEDEEVRAEDEQEHREGEERELDEEARVAAIAGHVAHRVEMDEHRDAGHDDQHHDGQRVDMEVDGIGELAEVEPVVDVKRDALRLEFMQGLLAGRIAQPAEELRADEAGVEEGEEHRAEGDPADQRWPRIQLTRHARRHAPPCASSACVSTVSGAAREYHHAPRAGQPARPLLWAA